MQVVGFSEYTAQGRGLATALGVPYAEAEIHIFPDGERKLRLSAPLAAHVVFCRSLNNPDHNLIELLLAAGSARDNNTQHLTLITPYLAYMRQDIAFHPSEAISQRIIGALLAQTFDAVITVDAHLHRIDHLSQAIPLPHTINLSATRAMGEFIARECPEALLLGPDGESEQWVGDVASTGRTLALAARQARDAGAAATHCLVTHGLFVGDALAQLKDAGIDKVWSTDSVPHASNCIALSGLLADAVKQITHP
ncbi:MAG: ribose-phosphate pyrophosphokinase-like domain-containing protein [Gammaproteobacteria bacterium]|nr:ribose-phosphate pyrophosphokinase-like domain-containing protein [Gammaproteobacteria bacterium]MCF6361979.1 ribose-phosphate pyrophosphokinase-like domain-containing protein [Gammaproteobacteria bacterium]